MAGKSGITIGVPLYRGLDFLEETLRSIQAQSFPEFEALLSLDGPDPETEKLCQPFLKDSRFRLFVQPKRLGWVGNLNWLMSQADSEFWCYQQQDDLLAENYLETLIEYAHKTPEAAVVYCDIVAFGQQSWTMHQPSVTGSASARQLALLYGHHPAVAFRGVTRTKAIKETGGIPANDVENFSSDTTWMAAVARWGELHRVPGALYRKRYHSENTHSKWHTWPEEKRNRAWRTHCADMLDQAMLVEATLQERRLLWLAVIARLISSRAGADFCPAPQTNPLRLFEEFLVQIRETRFPNLPEQLGTYWPNLEHWTKGFFADPVAA